ncbi:MAG: prephenate dehydrogenase/arogenate dehydrogenase family protein [Bacteroidales bacterium]
MRILILGAGKMGSFFTDLLSFDHDVAVLDKDPRKLRFVYNVQRFSKYSEVVDFHPDMVLNCVTLNYTVNSFKEIIPFLLDDSGQKLDSCILADIASVKTDLKNFYKTAGFEYVSVHPMFGPTFARLDNLQTENAIIINDSGVSLKGIEFFRSIFDKLNLHVCEYTFKEHDEVVAYSLSIPFATTLAFGSVMKNLDAPGTTFKKHLAITHGLLSEDDYLLQEILFNPHTPSQLDKIILAMEELKAIVETKNSDKMKTFLSGVRERVNRKK